VGILWIVLVSFAAGGLARLALPGPDPMPWWATILLGFGGGIVGGIVFRILFGTGGGLIAAVLGAILLLYLYRRFVQHRPLTGPAARRLPPR
jgi:uncharacterized membrane protein YeaQ/YmgE (transglycosylase-associated protein family)